MLDSETKKTIAKFSPMWTNKQVWEYEQIHEHLRFDLAYVKSKGIIESWTSNLGYPDSDIRDVSIRTFDHLLDGNELWIADKGNGVLEEKHVPYIMAVMTDLMIEEEICLNFRIVQNCLVISLDDKADVIDCKEFFEEFYHLATGFNFTTDTGIPEDETEAEMYLTRLQEEFDEKMKNKLSDKYLPGNNDPDTLNSE
jgi:hypothetical protein